MKKLFSLLACIVLLSTCQKAPEIIVTGQSQVDISDAPYSFTVTVQSNRPWSARCSEPWVIVSPSSVTTASDDPVTVTISVSRNSSYDVRSATVTFFAEEVTSEVKVSQGAKHAMILPAESKYFDVAADGKTIVIEVQANVDYDIEVTEGADWIVPVASKALPVHHHSFQVAENGTRRGRMGSIKFVNQAEKFEANVFVNQEFFPILVSKDTLLASGRGWTVAVETVGAQPEDYRLALEDRWLTLEGSEKGKDGGTRFLVSAAAWNPEEAQPRDSRIFVYYKHLPEPDTVVVHQYSRLPAFIFSSAEQVVKVPELQGNNRDSFVFWGDGTSDLWQAGIEHHYSESGEHKVIVELNGASRVRVTDFKTETRLNLRDLRK